MESVVDVLTQGINSLIMYTQQQEQRRQETDNRLAMLLETGASALRGNDNDSNMQDELMALLEQQQNPTQPYMVDDEYLVPPMDFENALEDAGRVNNAEEVAAGALLQVGVRSPTMVQVGGAPTHNGLTEEEIRLGALIGITKPNKAFFLRPKHQTLSELYNEWTGIGSNHQDALGGVEGRETHWKNKWQKHWSKAQTAHFSRTAGVVSGIRAYAKEQNLDPIDACAILQDEYKECKMSVGNMKVWFQNQGLVEKGKSRGRSKT
ncbi:unknown protein [Seminavis robusta]|uniref:Transcription activator GCR1-like domain-containing protein n=1 Tax=Seminavis robusta TaxID=568900 RepID=A0A9N8F480_9STRA|nr:unknown protein [Seminavis robusta]|eukprot:Sro3596_g349460.1 n/a (264) ;mRNA; r:910-1701